MAKHNSIALYGALYELLYLDIAECYGSSTKLVDDNEPFLGSMSTLVSRDCEEIRNRITNEGIGFLTKTLPMIGKRLDKALSGTSAFDTTGLETRSDGIPKLFGYMLERVLMSTTLAIREDACVDSIKRLRQLYMYMYKLELPSDNDTKNKVVSDFVATDAGLSYLEGLDDVGSRILAQARKFTCSVFGTLDHRNIVPRHGPGSVATGELRERKSRFSRLYRDLEQIYPFTEYFVSGLNHIADEPESITDLMEVSEACAKIVLVPKDSRGPRIISMEPLELQWIQQGLMRNIVPHLEHHPITRGHVNFTDQSINQRLALEGSKGGQWATLDMKEASDRVSLVLVMALFEDCPLIDGLSACRSKKTKLPDGTEMYMKKFAPMGSALCFPIESFVFYALCVSVLMVVCGLKQAKARKAVYVYGDDIIVKTEFASVLMQYLPLFDLMFNESKCCLSGFFRESCGCDAYKGIDVTPVRLRKRLISRGATRQLSAVIAASAVAQSNRLHQAGYYRAGEYIRRWVEGYLGPLPIVTTHDHINVFKSVALMNQSNLPSALAWVRSEVAKTVLNGAKVRYHGSDTHNYNLPEVRVWQVRSKTYSSLTHSWRSVLLWMSNPSSFTPTDTYANPCRIQLSKGWSVARLGL